MVTEILVYPFLFLALFFEVFLLITYLSKPAREARSRQIGTSTPSVALIIPCFNEEKTVASTAASALALDYPADKLEIILVNDGSTDDTLRIMQQFAKYPNVKIIDKENGGKHTALNAGIAATNAEIFGCLDADSYLAPDALVRTLACFDKPKVIAAFSSIAIDTPTTFLEHMQSADYLMGIFYRHALASINAFYVTPGPFSLYRREPVVAMGGFRFGQQTEDMEIALRFLRAGYEIDTVPRALVTTKAQPTVKKLVRQRVRWTSGFLRNMLFDYRDLISRKFGALGLIVLPLGIISPFAAILLFGITLYLTGKALVAAFILRQGIPLSWYVPSWSSLHSIDWFYMPITFFTLQTVLTIVILTTIVLIGKKISHAPNRVVRDIVSYVVLYSFVAPIWMLLASVDVVTGRRRGWR